MRSLRVEEKQAKVFAMTIKAKLYFEIELDFSRELYRPLKDAGGFYIKSGNGKYRWRFPLENISKVVEILGRQIVFDRKEVEEVVKHSEIVGEEIVLSREKGEGYINISMEKNVFIVKTVIGKEEQKFTVPVENVLKLWSVMFRHKIGEKIPSHKVAEEICREIGLTKYFRGGRFNWQEFFGTRRDYYVYFYLPVKILEKKGYVKHHRKGYVERLTDKPLAEIIKTSQQS